MIGDHETPSAAAVRVLKEKVNIDVETTELIDLGMLRYGKVCVCCVCVVCVLCACCVCVVCVLCVCCVLCERVIRNFGVP